MTRILSEITSVAVFTLSYPLKVFLTLLIPYRLRENVPGTRNSHKKQVVVFADRSSVWKILIDISA